MDVSKIVPSAWIAVAYTARCSKDATHPSGIGYVLPRWLEEKEDELLRPPARESNLKDVS